MPKRHPTVPREFEDAQNEAARAKVDDFLQSNGGSRGSGTARSPQQQQRQVPFAGGDGGGVFPMGAAGGGSSSSSSGGNMAGHAQRPGAASSSGSHAARRPIPNIMGVFVDRVAGNEGIGGHNELYFVLIFAHFPPADLWACEGDFGRKLVFAAKDALGWW